MLEEENSPTESCSLFSLSHRLATHPQETERLSAKSATDSKAAASPTKRKRTVCVFGEGTYDLRQQRKAVPLATPVAVNDEPS